MAIKVSILPPRPTVSKERFGHTLLRPLRPLNLGQVMAATHFGSQPNNANLPEPECFFLLNQEKPDHSILWSGPNGVSTYNTYNARDQIVTLKSICDECEWVISQYDYTYDDRGFITGKDVVESLYGQHE